MHRPKRSSTTLKNGPQKAKKPRTDANSKKAMLEDEPGPTNTQEADKASTQEIKKRKDQTSISTTSDNPAQGAESGEEEDDDEDGDDDYDPSKKPENVAEDESDVESDADENEQPDYSNIPTDVSQVRTRGQRVRDENELRNNGHLSASGFLADTSRANIDDIFESLQSESTDDWVSLVRKDDAVPDTGRSSGKAWNSGGIIKAGTSSTGGKENIESAQEAKSSLGGEEKITIFTTYTFAGKLVRESKTVDANSAEAKAYLNSTNGLTTTEMENSGPKKSYVTVLRPVPGMAEPQPLRIKLKRPSLIDKFLLGDKQTKLSTLEKSRLDWASFVDKKRLKDDLATHNKGGYLEKQDFLGRVEANRDVQYQKAKELDRQRQWQQEQQQKSKS